MKRKLPWLFALLLLAATAVWLEPTRVVRGWLRGEAFYQGRPTSYWSRELSRWDQEVTVIWHVGPAAAVSPTGDERLGPIDPLAVTTVNWIDLNTRARSPSFLDRAAGWFGVESERPTYIPLHDGDPAAGPVLHELVDDPAELVRDHARRGLRRIEFNERSRSLQP